jgi:HK97 family phage prohead protease
LFVRFKGGDFPPENGLALVEFLRGVSTKGGELKEAVEVFAAAPFAKAAEDAPGADWTFSTFDLDRYDERIDPKGWDLKGYLKNPVVQWAHRSEIPAIGRAENVYADDAGLHGTVVFNAREFDGFGWSVGERVRAGALRAGSVGFRVLEVELPAKGKEDGAVLIFRRQELLEFSVCNVPANPFALRKEFGHEKHERHEKEDFWGGVIKGFSHGGTEDTEMGIRRFCGK